MKIIDILHQEQMSLSYEVFPPKKETSFESVRIATEQIAALKKDKAWAFPEKESNQPNITGAVPAGSGGNQNNNQSDVALINGLLGL